jgi:hypothetical protein
MQNLCGFFMLQIISYLCCGNHENDDRFVFIQCIKIDREPVGKWMTTDVSEMTYDKEIVRLLHQYHGFPLII